VNTFGLLYYFFTELLGSSAGLISWFLVVAGAFLAITDAVTLLGLTSCTFFGDIRYLCMSI
jgi:hypothetical protein